MIKIRTLKSGIRLVMEEIPYMQSAAFGAWVRVGAVNENSENAGISHFIEHMMFKGTENRNARQIAEDIDKIGGQINAFTSKETTCYYVKSLYNNLYKAADVILDMLANSKFDSAEMDKERKVICEEIKMTLDSPDDLAHDEICELMFKGNALGKSIIGTPETLAKIDRDVMVNYIKEEYTKDRIVFSVAGKFNEDELVAFLDEKLMDYAFSKECEEKPQVPYEPRFKSIVKDIEQSHICLATRGIKLEDSRFYALSILNNVMGGSMSSRFFQNIREEKGLAYSVYSMSSAYVAGGYYNIYAAVGHDMIEKAIDGIKVELNYLKEKNITEEEFLMSKEQLKGNYIFGQENVSGRMFSIGKSLILKDKVFTPEEVLAKLDAVTLEDINEVRALISDYNSYSGVVISSKKIDLEKIWK